MLITIKKIKDVSVRTESGDEVKNPINKDENITREEVLIESIDVWSIKSIRPFGKDFSKDKHSDVQEDISVIYLYGNIKGRRDPSMHVVGNHLKLVQEVNDLRSRAQKNSR